MLSFKPETLAAVIFGYEPPEMKSDFCKKDYKNAFAKSISNIVKNIYGKYRFY